ncbi:L,D-transpeptidase family protein [Aquabacterium sp. A7-Y]|uniref:L,D-transpeptidase family protein n=1 Tax=Aquabacterium sp. A7-Y TaxID=1349605 RepID=UPI00223DA440|nr:L,D-transpeptidase family protein [Aquabacterium sp. A7-Y]MCW7536937.1 L,D-transpeptidase family protein [Aquabacterium sp. A7-Y]
MKLLSTSGAVAAAALLLGLAACGDGGRQGSDRAAATGASSASQPALAGAAEAIRSRIAGPAAASGTQDAARPPADASQDLEALYAPGAYAPLWFDAKRRLTPVAAEAVTLLSGSVADGLDPADYAAAQLAAGSDALKGGRSPEDQDIAALDLAFSEGVLRYLRHLHTGRVDPRKMGFSIPRDTKREDLPALLRSALQQQNLGELVERVRPPLEPYRSLRAALARYRTLAAQPAPAALPAAAELKPGQAYAGIPALHQRLVLLGDLPVDSAAPSGGLYEGALVDGVKRFQTRHGLEAHGVLNKATLAALEVPAAQRVRQIELSLERLRWFPRLEQRRFVGINIPMFRLWAGGPETLDGKLALHMNVIVGKALNTETPAMVEEMRYIVFSPYWNVPPSIVQKELLPALERDPEHLAKQEMELVRGNSDDAEVVETTPENLALLQRGELRVRQRPGPRNSLGPAKFIFPNDESVYLHGTPAKQLFDRLRRDLSHGCVRVEDPAALALWALQDQPEWTRERVEAAMAGGQQVKVDLKEPIQVLLFYLTAMAMPGEDEVHFAADIYGHDKKLEQALAQRPR